MILDQNLILGVGMILGLNLCLGLSLSLGLNLGLGLSLNPILGLKLDSLQNNKILGASAWNNEAAATVPGEHMTSQQVANKVWHHWYEASTDHALAWDLFFFKDSGNSGPIIGGAGPYIGGKSLSSSFRRILLKKPRSAARGPPSEGFPGRSSRESLYVCVCVYIVCVCVCVCVVSVYVRRMAFPGVHIGESLYICACLRMCIWVGRL
jgi:hypothetical protein